MTDAATCPNCAAPRADGDFCPRCGQRNRHGRLRFTELASDVLEQFVEWRMPWLTTLVDLTWRPGPVALDFIEGRRARYVNPVKYCFIVVAIAYAVKAYLLHTHDGGAPANVLALIAIPFEVMALRAMMWRTARSATEITVLALYVTAQTVIFSQLFIELPIEAIGTDGLLDDVLIAVVGAALGVYATLAVRAFFGVAIWYATLAFCAAFVAAMLGLTALWFKFQIG